MRLKLSRFLQRIMSTQIKQTPDHLGRASLFGSRGNPNQEPVDLIVGAPDVEALLRAREIFRKSSEKFSSDPDVNVYQYGPQWGYEPYLRNLSTFLSSQYHDSVDPNDLILTSGATSGLWLTSSVLLKKPPHGIVFVEDPTYFIASKVLQDNLNYKIVPVSLNHDGSGVNVEELRAKVKEEYAKHQFDQSSEKDKKKFWAMFYTIPTFQNPTGSVLSRSKCNEVIKIAREFDILVFCDDVYNLLHLKGKGPDYPRLYSLDDRHDNDYKGNVISNGTFSKILGPGFRLGWMEIAPRMFEAFANSGILISGGCLNNVTAGLVSTALQMGLIDNHLEFLRQEYASRSDAMSRILKERLPNGFKFSEPQGGFFIWISGPDDFDSKRFSDWLSEEHKIMALSSVKCGSSTNSLRLSFAFNKQERLIEATNKLCLALHAFIAMK